MAAVTLGGVSASAASNKEFTAQRIAAGVFGANGLVLSAFVCLGSGQGSRLNCEKKQFHVYSGCSTHNRYQRQGLLLLMALGSCKRLSIEDVQNAKLFRVGRGLFDKGKGLQRSGDCDQ